MSETDISNLESPILVEPWVCYTAKSHEADGTGHSDRSGIKVFVQIVDHFGEVRELTNCQVFQIAANTSIGGGAYFDTTNKHTDPEQLELNDEIRQKSKSNSYVSADYYKKLIVVGLTPIQLELAIQEMITQSNIIQKTGKYTKIYHA